MKRIRTVLIGFGLLSTLLIGSSALRGDDQEGGKVIDAFLTHVDQLSGVDQSTKDQVKATVDKLRQDPETQADAISEGLMVLHPEYAQALGSADADGNQALDVLRPWIESKDSYVAADASFFLARALVNAERFEDAMPLLDALATQQAPVTLHRSAATYFLGVTHAKLLDNQKAVNALSYFLQQFPSAPERLRVSAWRQIQELVAIEEGQLADAHQRMDFSRRKLGQEDSGETTQEQQDKIVGILAKLIREQEKKECSSCNSKKNCQGENQSQAKKSGKKDSDSQAGKSQQGGKSNNPNGVAERIYSDGPASPWSKLRDRSRDPAYTAIKDQLPAKYRDIVERYTEKAQGGQPAGGSE